MPFRITNISVFLAQVRTVQGRSVFKDFYQPDKGELKAFAALVFSNNEKAFPIQILFV